MLAPSINRMLIYVCLRLYAVRCRPSLSNRRFSSSVMVLKSSLCHLGKMRSVGSGVRHSFPRTSELSATSVGARTPEPSVAQRGLQGLAQRHDFVVHGAVCRRLATFRNCLLVSVNSIIHDFSRGDLRDVHVSEEGHQVNARP